MRLTAVVKTGIFATLKHFALARSKRLAREAWMCIARMCGDMLDANIVFDAQTRAVTEEAVVFIQTHLDYIKTRVGIVITGGVFSGDREEVVVAFKVVDLLVSEKPTWAILL